MHTPTGCTRSPAGNLRSRGTQDVPESRGRAEQRTLEELYAPRASFLDLHGLSNGPTVQAYVTKLLEIRKAFSPTASINQASAHEEQERELAAEVEEERQVQRPAPAKAANHKLLGDVVSFVQKGSVVFGSTAYENAFNAVRKTTFAETLQPEESVISGKFLASADHLDTSKLSAKDNSQSLDHYQRPVNWVLWSMKSNTALVISPYEAEHLVEQVRASQHVHLLTYAAPVTRKMLHFDNLNFYSIPELPENWVAPSWLVNFGIIRWSSLFQTRRVCSALRLAASASAFHQQQQH